MKSQQLSFDCADAQQGISVYSCVDQVFCLGDTARLFVLLGHFD